MIMKKYFAMAFALCAVILIPCITLQFLNRNRDLTGVMSRTVETTIDLEEVTLPNNARDYFYCTSINSTLLYEVKGEFTQGMCMSDDHIYIAAADHNGNDYKIRKLDKNTLVVLGESTECYNHANGMAYNKNTNELVITGLDGRSGLYGTSGSQDYSLFVCDADTLKTKTMVCIENIVKGISPDLLGISEIAYNDERNQYFVSTHYPNRYLIVLNEDFSLNSYMFMEPHSESRGLHGDMTCDDNYIYFCRWMRENDVLLSAIDRYTYDGEFKGSCYLYGVTHIESIEIGSDGYCYANFIDFSNTRDLELYKFKIEDGYVLLDAGFYDLILYE